MDGVENVLDQIYEAALLPEFWPDALTGINQFVGLDGGALFVASEENVRWTATNSYVETVSAFIEEERWRGNARNTRALTLKHAGFITDQQVFSPEELEREPIFTEFLRPRGWGWASGSVIMMPTGEILTFHFENYFHRGPVGHQSVRLLDELRPHLARSALLSCRLHLEKMQASLSGIEALGFPAVVLDAGGRVLAANSNFGNLGSAVVARAHGGFALRNPKANGLVQQALEQVAKGHRSPRSIATPGTEEHPPFVFHVIPVRRSAHDLFFGSEAFLVVTPVGRPTAPPFEVLNALFDLTPGEARVTRLLTSGLSPSEIAKVNNVSVETIRVQIRSVLQKSGMHRQAELVGFLSGIDTFNSA
ncbi:HTH luxR-type domain-containing protein [Hyphomicrobiales bacterium]|nr:HTH luxR-type domain-containing protein [Hyphomicrobiales bacterium]CAH1699463.1 HTH luxR-type domain-containing protein [Hyphomicrobiales bacterium]CAI0343251.1 HTH luxR-type domain-containing protein [Hyphomicrobiales bacterium]